MLILFPLPNIGGILFAVLLIKHKELLSRNYNARKRGRTSIIIAMTAEIF